MGGRANNVLATPMEKDTVGDPRNACQAHARGRTKEKTWNAFNGLDALATKENDLDHPSWRSRMTSSVRPTHRSIARRGRLTMRKKLCLVGTSMMSTSTI